MSMAFQAIELADRAALVVFFEKMRLARGLPEGKHGVFATVAKDGKFYAIIHTEDEAKIAPDMADEKIVRDVTLLARAEPVPEAAKEPIKPTGVTLIKSGR